MFTFNLYLSKLWSRPLHFCFPRKGMPLSSLIYLSKKAPVLKHLQNSVAGNCFMLQRLEKDIICGVYSAMICCGTGVCTPQTFTDIADCCIPNWGAFASREKPHLQTYPWGWGMGNILQWTALMYIYKCRGGNSHRGSPPTLLQMLVWGHRYACWGNPSPGVFPSMCLQGQREETLIWGPASAFATMSCFQKCCRLVW